MRTARCDGGPTGAARRLRSPAARALLVLVWSPALLLAACSAERPATREDLCTAYHEYQRELLQPHLISNASVFRSLRKLGDVAARYEENAQVRSAGPALKKMGESDSFDLGEATRALLPVLAVCGPGPAG